MNVIMVPTAGDAPPPEADTVVVVLDTAWTPGPGGRPDVLPVGPFVASVLERVDLFAESLRRLDAWAESAGMIGRLSIAGFSIWYALREELWHWLHERLLWRMVVANIVEQLRPTRLQVRGEDEALVEVAGLVGGPTLDVTVEPAVVRALTIERRVSTANGAGPFGRLMRIAGAPRKRLRRRRLATRLRLLDARVRAMVDGSPDRVIVLSYTRVQQRIHGASSDRSMDPNLGAVIERMRLEGPEPIVIGLGLDHGDDASWAAIDADPRLLPQSLLAARWRRNDGPDPALLASLDDGVRGAATVPLDLDGIDVGPALAARVRTSASAWLAPTLVLTARVGQMIEELRPGAMLLTHEGIRAAWLAAARRAGVPTFAVQHGMLYPTHPGYCHPRDPTLILPDRTFVYGAYERDVLLEHGGYRPNEVEVSGSPRLGLDLPEPREDQRDAERSAVRRELGIQDGDRLLVVSTAHAPLLRRFHLVHMIEKSLGGPLPGIHVVFKQHPGETDEGPYRALLGGLARAGGYAPPPMTVVRDVDLYRLLRACDAHLGLHSTVLTDAVVAGVPNLIAVVQAYRDPLDYLTSGVARPVREVADVRAEVDNPTPPDPAARRAFLDRHFMPGDASMRIVARVRNGLVERRAEPMPPPPVRPVSGAVG